MEPEPRTARQRRPQAQVELAWRRTCRPDGRLSCLVIATKLVELHRPAWRLSVVSPKVGLWERRTDGRGGVEAVIRGSGFLQIALAWMEAGGT